MFNKQILIFLSIFSFSLQDNNCFIYYERCEGEGKEDKPYQGKIDNCIAGSTDGDGNEMCYQCKNGYYVSMEGTSCIKVEKQIEKCLSYSSNGDELFCSYCDKGYITSADQKTCKESKNCEYLTTNAKEEEICGECDTGYALTYDEKSCKQFENCEKLAQGNEKCSECYEYFHPNSEGKCERTLCQKYENNVCTECYEGYYLDDDKKCQKIAIENCLKLDSSKTKCTSCLGGIPPDANGKCSLPLIKGCSEYDDNGKCKECKNQGYEYEITKDGTCKFIECKNGKKYEYCNICKVGYYRDEDENDNYICIGYDGSRDTSTSSDSSSRNKVESALLIFILAFLI
jgi:hypothetical protein